MFKDLFNFKIFGESFGIDLGTSNTLIYAKGKGIILNMPSVLAISSNDGKILAVGEEAKKMIGKTPQNILAIRPLQDGVIADFDITQKMFEYFISKVQPGHPLVGPKIVIGVPSRATKVEKKAVIDIAIQVGARQVHLVDEPVAAVIGANLPISEPLGNMIVDIGGGTSEASIISLNGVVISNSTRIAGDEMDQAIIQYLKENYNLLIGEQMAEWIKLSIGCACSPPQEKRIKVKGRSLTDGFPAEIEISSKEVSESLSSVISAICNMIETALEQSPPELAGDIMERGICLTGGGACLGGLDKYISEKTHLSVKVAPDPLFSVALGTGKLLEDKKLLSIVEITSSIE
jgi:rod shape-determining protein MreB